MDKFIKNAAIYLTIKSSKEDNYFISQKIKRIEEYCRKKNIQINHTFIVYKDQQENFCESQFLEDQIEKNQIQLLIIEESESVSKLGKVEIEKVCL